MLLRRIALILVLACAGVATCAPVAPAGPGSPWVGAQTLSGSHLFVDPPRIVAGTSGDALAWWTWQDGLGEAARTGTSMAAFDTDAGRFRRERPAPSGLVDVATVGASRAFAALQRGGSRARLAVAAGRTDGRFGRARAVAGGRGVRGVRLATGTAGDAALAWWEDRGTRTDRVRVSLRAPGGQFGRPLRLATDSVRSVAIAVGPAGQTVVAWEARGVVRARVRPRRGRAFGPAETIVSEPTFGAELRAAVTPEGRIHLAWSAQARSEGGTLGPVFVQAALRPAGGRRFQPAQLLMRQDAGLLQAPVELVVAGRRSVVLAWTGSDGLHRRAAVAATTADGRFGGITFDSPPGTDAVVTGLVARGGERIVAWDSGVADDRGQVSTASTPRGFFFPEPVPATGSARGGALVAGRSPVRALVVWSSRPAGSGLPLRTYAQGAFRVE